MYYSYNLFNKFIIAGIMSMDLQNCHRFNLGSPVMPSHPSNWELENFTGLNQPFWRRLVNFVNTWWNIYISRTNNKRSPKSISVMIYRTSPTLRRIWVLS